MREIIVDDYFPCNAQMKDPLFAKPNGIELWVMLLEKAWLKNFKEFTWAEESSSEYAFEEILGAPSKSHAFKDFNNNPK